jgi:hypothetical protein
MAMTSNVRVLAALLLASSLVACKRHPKSAAPASDPAPTTAAIVPPATMGEAAPPAQGIPGETIQGRVREKIDVAQYTYLRLDTASGEVWTAVPKSQVATGEAVTVANAMWMENFKSSTLDRTWPRIAFGTLSSAPASGQTTGAAAKPQGPGMFAAAAASAPSSAAASAPSSATASAATTAELPPGHPQPAAPVDVGDVHVAKASGPRGRTIADIHAQKAELKEKPVAVRGKVVKATNGVLGKNWLHLRDGTGSGETADLTVATTDTAAVGATVLVTGTVRLDRDLGAGYHYDVIVEDARLQQQ